MRVTTTVIITITSHVTTIITWQKVTLLSYIPEGYYSYLDLHFIYWRLTRTFWCPPPPLWRNSPTQASAASFSRLLDHTQWHTTVGRTPLGEGSARHRDLYLTTHDTHIHAPSGIFFSLNLSVLLRPYCPAFCLLSLLCNTQQNHPCPRRDSNPQSPQSNDRRPSL